MDMAMDVDMGGNRVTQSEINEHYEYTEHTSACITLCFFSFSNNNIENIELLAQ